MPSVSNTVSAPILLKQIDDWLMPVDINGPDQESTEGIIPEDSWPSQGSIQVENFSVRYGQDLPDVLHDVTFNVEVSAGRFLNLCRAD